MTEISAMSEDEIRTAPLNRLLARARSLADLEHVGRIRGYKPGWAGHQWGRLQVQRGDPR